MTLRSNKKYVSSATDSFLVYGVNVATRASRCTSPSARLEGPAKTPPARPRVKAGHSQHAPRPWVVSSDDPRLRDISGHSEALPNPLIDLRAKFAFFSERPLSYLAELADFDSAIRRFESSRPSHIAVRRCSLELAPVHKLLREREKARELDRSRPHPVS